MARSTRKARATRHPVSGFTIQFIPGGFYHYRNSRLHTGIKNKLASDKVQAKLMPLTYTAIRHLGEWVAR